MILKRKVFFIVLSAIAIHLMFVPDAAIAASGYAWIGDVDNSSPYDLSADASGAGWSWFAAEDKLTVNSTYTYYINIDCDSNDVINLVVDGNVKISEGAYGSAIVVSGSLNISGTGTLTLLPSATGTEYSIPTMRIAQDLTVSGVNLTVTANDELNKAIFSEYGDVMIKSDAKITATTHGKRGIGIYAYENVIINDNAQVIVEGTGSNIEGIVTHNGDINIESAAVVRAKGSGEGFSLNSRSGSININSNNVTLLADDEWRYYSITPQGTGDVKTFINSDRDGNDDGNSDSGGGGGCSTTGFEVLGILAVAGFFMSQKRHTK